jgi:hypothetical protein
MRRAWKINSYKMLVQIPERKRPVEKPKRTWEENIKVDLKQVGRRRDNSVV